jgi:hypothetical protein
MEQLSHDIGQQQTEKNVTTNQMFHFLFKSLTMFSGPIEQIRPRAATNFPKAF